MSIIGIGRGLVKTAQGLIEGDMEKAARGAGGTAFHTAGSVLWWILDDDDETSETLAQKGDEVLGDDA